MSKKGKLLLTIVSIILLVIGLIFLLVGGIIAKWDIIGWFSSRYAMMFYICIVVWVVVLVIFIVIEKVNKL